MIIQVQTLYHQKPPLPTVSGIPQKIGSSLHQRPRHYTSQLLLAPRVPIIFNPKTTQEPLPPLGTCPLYSREDTVALIKLFSDFTLGSNSLLYWCHKWRHKAFDADTCELFIKIVLKQGNYTVSAQETGKKFVPLIKNQNRWFLRKKKEKTCCIGLLQILGHKYRI